jgi:hypothetical protein
MRWRSAAVASANAVVLGLLLSEGVARCALTDFYRCDEELGWAFVADRSGFRIDRRGEYALRVKINRDGFHDVEHAAAAAPDTIRVVLLGDSMLAGLQVPLERGFARRLEHELNASAGTSGALFEVFNCATDGFSTAQAWRMFEKRCARYRPELVVLGTFLWNDLADNHPAVGSLNHPIAHRCGRPYFALRRGQIVAAADEVAARRHVAGGFDRLLRNSYLYQIAVAPPGRSRRKFTQKELFAASDTPAVAEAWQILDALLRTLSADVAERGARLAVMAVPSRLEIEGAASPAAARLGADMEPGSPHRRLLAQLDAAGIPSIDPGPALREAMRNESEPPYFRRDLHWTEKGNEVMGRFVAGWIREHCASLGLPARACSATKQPVSH